MAREVKPIANRLDPRAEPSDVPPAADRPPHVHSGIRHAHVPHDRPSAHPTLPPHEYPELATLREELRASDDHAADVAQLREVVARKERQIAELAEALRRANAEKAELTEIVERLRRFIGKLSKG